MGDNLSEAEKLMRQMKDVVSEIQDLNWSISDLEDSITTFRSYDINREKAEEILKTYKRDLEIQGLWSKELDEHLDMFIKFDLPKIL